MHNTFDEGAAANIMVTSFAFPTILCFDQTMKNINKIFYLNVAKIG